MSFAFARSRYRQADTIKMVTPSNPHDVVYQTLKELTRAMNVLAEAHAQDRQLPPDQLNRALTAIYILQSSLDFELGGDIADDLFQLYEFTRFHVLKAWRNEPEPRLREGADAMAEILSAWQGIGTSVGSAVP